MKYGFYLILSCVRSNAQDESKNFSYLTLGYDVTAKSYSNAYAGFKAGDLSSDLSSLNLNSDRMIYSNWRFRYGFLNEETVYGEMEVTSIFYVIYSLFSKSAREKPNNMWGVGKMKQFED